MLISLAFPVDSSPLVSEKEGKHAAIFLGEKGPYNSPKTKQNKMVYC